MKKLYVAPDADIVRFVAEERMADTPEESLVGGNVNGGWNGGWDGGWDD